MKIIVMSIKEFKFYVKDLKDIKVIMSTSTEERLDQVNDKLILRYDDVLTGNTLTDEMAQKIVEYTDTVKDKTLYVLCDAGQSRSTAIAGAINLAYNFDDNMIWDNPKYSPNRLVYTKVIKAYNIDLTDKQIDEKVRRNELALRKAINKTR